MPADGQIVIDYDVDTSGALKGEAEVEKATQNLKNAVTSAGREAAAAVQQMNATLSDMAQKADSTGTKFHDMMEEFGETGDTSLLPKMFGETESAINNIAKQLYKIGDKQTLGSLTDGQMAKMSQDLDKAEASIGSLQAKMQELGAASVPSTAFNMLAEKYDQLQEKAQSLQNIIADKRGIDTAGDVAALEKVKQEMADVMQQMAQLESTGGDRTMLADLPSFQTQAQDLQQLLNAVQTYRTALAQTREENTANASMAGIAKGADQLTNQLGKIEAAQAKINSPTSLAAWQAQIQKAQADLERLQQQMQQLGASGFQSPQFADVGAQLEGLQGRLAACQSASTDMAGTMTAMGSDTAKAGQRTSALSRIFQGMQGAVNLAKRGLQGIIGIAQRLGSAFGGAIKGIRNFISRLGSLRGSANSASISSKGLLKGLLSIKTMLMSRLKRSFISTIVKDFQASMGSLAKYSAQFNATMSGMQNSSTAVSGNLAVLASNILNTLGPAITTIIDWISKAIATINALFALITGAGTFTMATKGTKDYAKSLKGAGGAAKELKNQVYGFDELNKRTDNSSGGGGGGGGGGAKYTKKNVKDFLPQSLIDLAEAIKEAFNAGEFEKVGQLVAEALNQVVYAADDWINNVLRPKAVEWTTIIARIMNGFVAAFDWSALGKLIADALNTVADVLNTFFTTFDFRALASGFAEGINGIINNIEWDLLGQTVGNGLQGIADLITGTLAGIDWASLGSGLATGLNNLMASVDMENLTNNLMTTASGLAEGFNNLFAEIDWAALGTLVGAGLQGIGESITTFFSSIDWLTLGQGMAEGVNNAVAAMDLPAIGAAMSDTWTSILDGLNAFLTDTRWSEISTQLSGFVNSIDWPELGAKTGELLGNVFRTAFDLAKEALAGIDWQAVGTGIVAFFQGINFDGLFDSLFSFIGTALAGLTEIMQQAIGPAIDALGSWWDEQMQASGGNAGIALINGLSDVFMAISDWVHDHIVAPLIGGLESGLGLEEGTIRQFCIDLMTGVAQGIADAWTTVSNLVETAFGYIWDAANTALEGAAEFGKNIWEGIKNGLSDAWQSLQETILQPFTDFWNSVLNFFGIHSPSTEAASVGDYILQGLSQGLLDGVESVLATVADVFGRIWDAIKRIFGFGGKSDESQDAETAGRDLMTGMSDGIKGNEETVKKSIKDAAKHAMETLRQELGIASEGAASTKTKDVGKGFVTGVADGITEKAIDKTFQGAVTKVWNAIEGCIKSSFGTGGSGSSAANIKYVGEGVDFGIRDGIQSKANKGTFAADAQTLLTAVRTAIHDAFGTSGGGAGATQMRESGEMVVTGVSDGMAQKAQANTFSSSAGKVRDAAVEALKSAVGASGGGLFSSSGASKFNDIGRAICQGVADGINKNTSVIKHAAVRAANAAIAAAKNALGVHSPSTVFAEIGSNLMQGMALGLKDDEKTVTKTVAAIASDLTAGMADGATVETGLVADGLGAMVAELSHIADVFGAIGTTLAQMGGLQMPDIARGAYTPPMAVQTVTAAASGSGMTDRFEQNFDETMSDQRDVLRDILTAIQGLDLTIDGNSLSRSINALQRSRIQAYGGM